MAFRVRTARRSLPTAHTRPSASDLAQLRRLFTFTQPYRLALIIGILAVMVAGLLSFAFPLFARELFNTAFTDDAAQATELNRLILLLLGVFVVQGLFNYLRVYYLAQVGEGTVADLRKALYNHLLSLPVQFFETRKVGEITSRLTSDIATVQGVVSQSLAQFINQLLTLVGGVIFLFYLNWRLTLVMLAVLPPAILAGAYFGRRLRRISTEFQDRVADANASAEEAIAGIRVVKAFTAEALERERYRSRVDDSYQVALRRARVRAIFVPSIIMAMFTGISIVLWYGSRQVMLGALAAGDLIAFLLLTVFVAGSIGSFTGLYSQFQETVGASKRIFDLLAEVSDLPEPTSPTRLEPVLGKVRFEQVTFRYGDRGDEDVLHAISFTANPGEVIALVGPSGAGKSTLISLIPRFYDPQQGRILIDSTDIRQLKLQELRQRIGMVPQETLLFSGTVAENIRYGRPTARDDEVEEAARAANAHAFIQAFPDGYQTIVGERGVKLSGGQRQRVAIARALLKDPRILILDEATSSLDSESEALVQEALERLMQGRTTFVIAHRLSTVLGADRILVLDRGRIVQSGTHSALIKQGGLYHDLYQKQFRSVPDYSLTLQ